MKSPLRQSSVAHNEEEACLYRTSIPLYSATKICMHIDGILEGINFKMRVCENFVDYV